MTQSFTDHLGRARQIFKHRHAVAGHVAGKLSDTDLAQKPWFFRVQANGNDTVRTLGTSDTREALRLAKGLCRDAGGDNNKIAQVLDKTAARGVLTCDAIAEAWATAGYPDTEGRPRNAIYDQKRFVNSALAYFGRRAVASISRVDKQKYHAHVVARVQARIARLGKRRSPAVGHRTAEMEITALSNCLDWAISREMIEVNPVSGWRRIRREEDTINHRFLQPRDANELHAIARWLWSDGNHTGAARVLFHAMTGLRPGEAAPLRWHSATMMEGTPGFRWMGLPINLGYTTEGTPRVEFLYVQREKSGNNPAVIVHPALRAMLAAWRSYLESQSGTGRVDDAPMFPTRRGNSQDILSDWINEAMGGLGSPKNRFGYSRRTAHSLRAFFVSVRRSQGANDTQISTELGQRTGARMVQTYGDATDVFGSGRLGWLPSDGNPPAWELFHVNPAGAGIVAFPAARAAA